jgi:putative hydrolase of the HAD superfamily
MGIDAVLFDLDNTLVNRKLAFSQYTDQFIDTYLVETEPDERNRIFEYIREADRDGYRSKKELYMELLKELNWKRETSLDELLNHWFAEFFKCTVLMDGAVEVLEHMQKNGMKLGLITNGSTHAQHAKINQVGLWDHFNVIIVSDDVQIKKPDRRVFDMALQQLDVKPERSIFIGDHPTNDIEGARKAGMNVVWFQGFREWDKSIEKPNYVITHLKELENIIGKL